MSRIAPLQNLNGCADDEELHCCRSSHSVPATMHACATGAAARAGLIPPLLQGALLSAKQRMTAVLILVQVEARLLEVQQQQLNLSG